MKYIVLILTLLSLSACLDDTKPLPKEEANRRAKEFMSNFAKCENDCKIKKSFLDE